jgi:putative sigma-54 modulation protein
VHIVLSTEKYRQIAEIALNARGTEIVSREESDDMMISIDRVVERVERQIKRLTSRRRKGRRGASAEAVRPAPAMLGAEGDGAAEEAAAEGLEDDESYPPVVVREEQSHPDPITVEDAIEVLKDRGDPFLLFKNARSGKVAVVHLRDDGNYGLVEGP